MATNHFNHPFLEVNSLTRSIVDNHISSLIWQRRIKDDSPGEMQKLLDIFILQSASMEKMFDKAQLYDAIIAHLALFRLDSHSHNLFESNNKREINLWPDLRIFLLERSRALQALSNDARSRTNPTQRSASAHVSDVKLTKPQSSDVCALCQGNHRLRMCSLFIEMSIPKRQENVNELKLCNNCLGSHSTEACQSKFSCRLCQHRHNTMLHTESVGSDEHNKPLLTSPSPSESSEPVCDPQLQEKHQSSSKDDLLDSASATSSQACDLNQPEGIGEASWWSTLKKSLQDKCKKLSTLPSAKQTAQ
jgi:hypothetical protein